MLLAHLRVFMKFMDLAHLCVFLSRFCELEAFGLELVKLICFFFFVDLELVKLSKKAV